MPRPGSWPSSTFHTVWNRHPAVKYQPGNPPCLASASAAANTRSTTGFRSTNARKRSTSEVAGRGVARGPTFPPIRELRAMALEYTEQRGYPVVDSEVSRNNANYRENREANP